MKIKFRLTTVGALKDHGCDTIKERALTPEEERDLKHSWFCTAAGGLGFYQDITCESGSYGPLPRKGARPATTNTTDV